MQMTPQGFETLILHELMHESVNELRRDSDPLYSLIRGVSAFAENTFKCLGLPIVPFVVRLCHTINVRQSSINGKLVAKIFCDHDLGSTSDDLFCFAPLTHATWV
jgi:hypothetical protein